MSNVSSKPKKAFSKSIFDTLLQAYRPFLVRIIAVVILGFVGRLIFLSNAQLIAKFYDTHAVVTREDLVSLTSTLLIVLTVSFCPYGFIPHHLLTPVCFGGVAYLR